ncbi:radical SAM protein [archaeon]|jgi:MoaA/NifB/PqqE/SkfB family radical SAM enzyme|nr:radical SAM protein [archaeon]MBT3578293.1 radical SAM protein [archaeon]MBT6819786.1 radical SAM protein [archaeon]MBT6955811.1 radical SAM protein [archaeon]MBT7025568.1 radical SAM protein [archaeon]
MATSKEWTDQYNPFNSAKLMAQIPKWRKIIRGEEIPAPTLVTIDPINSCNYGCTWCNAEYILDKNTGKIGDSTLEEIADYLPKWGVDAVCIAGGGEPLIHPYLGKLVGKLAEGNVKSGIVTNGLYLDRHMDYLNNCTWVGVSMDCASQETLEKLKKAKQGDFDRTIKGIEKLASLGGTLGGPGQGHGVSYKYLLHPGNVSEVYEAAKIARETGCRNLHIRPFGTPWDQVGQKPKDTFSIGDLEEFNDQIERARELETDTFKVFGITHKFDGNFRKQNEFDTCHAIFMTGVFMPPQSSEGKYSFGLCCDRRGDEGLTLPDLTSTSQVTDFWGSEEHWKMFDKIKPENCPRCTYQPHNQIFEKAVEEDNMTVDFI